MERTMKDALNALKVWAEHFGFKCDSTTYSRFHLYDETKTVNFIVHEEHDYYFQQRKVNVRLIVTAAIATMGGCPTGDELKEMANVIERAGRMVNTLQMNINRIEYTETF